MIMAKRNFTKEQVLQIREMYKNGVTSSVLADKFECAGMTIRQIVNGMSYKDYPNVCLENQPKKQHIKLT